MVQMHKVTFGVIERLSRAFIGFILLLLSFTVAINSEWFVTLHFVALYPLFTALIAWDPIYMLVELVKERWLDFWILH